MPTDILSYLETLPLLMFLAIILLGKIDEWRRSDEDRVAEVHRLYQDGKITESEMERRIGHLVDDRNERIRRVVEQVTGIGPSHAEQLAWNFDSVADLETATVDDLQAVNGIGPSRADAIRSYLSPGLHEPDSEADLEREVAS